MSWLHDWWRKSHFVARLVGTIFFIRFSRCFSNIAKTINFSYQRDNEDVNSCPLLLAIRTFVHNHRISVCTTKHLTMSTTNAISICHENLLHLLEVFSLINTKVHYDLISSARSKSYIWSLATMIFSHVPAASMSFQRRKRHHQPSTRVSWSTSGDY